MPKPIQTALIGVGGMARHHLRIMLQMQDTTRLRVLCEPSDDNYQAARALFKEAGLRPPPNIPDLNELIRQHGDKLDAAFIITPHAYHHDQTLACLDAGIDVLLEKPMVMTAAEAQSLIAARDRTGRLLVVAFQGSLSPNVRAASAILRSGDLGKTLTISGVIWQDWGPHTVGTWRQDPPIAGGGFMFDTGAHMLNTVADLAGEDFVEVAAWLDNNGRPVDTRSAIMGRLRSGTFVTISGCGETIPSCASDIRIFCEQAILRTGAWGEFLEMQKSGQPKLRKVKTPASLGVWEQFLAVRSGQIANPSPPEVGLRMSRLWDAIKASAAQNGQVVKL
jgi:predicted dehydrogenase